MIIFPAIDIKNGHVVRLLQGKFDQVTEYAHNPTHIAHEWQDLGAQWLHLVDLDGAKEGAMQNTDIIIDIARSISIPVQVGGGIRSMEDIAKLIDGNVKRVILGTKIIRDLEFLAKCTKKWKDKIAVSLDCSNGYVAERGWTSTTNIKATDFVKELEKAGLQCLIYTDIARDGMLTGPNLDALKELCALTDIPIIASGGISNLEDIRKLVTIENMGIIGAITGKALYERTLDLKEALALC